MTTAAVRADAVLRSALAIKAMTYAPSGAMVAAATTSLPEEICGHRNWDYRFTWIRDTTLTLTSLFVLGFNEEADDFKFWLERTGAGRPEDLQIMYGIGGERWLPELELPHLAGHRGSTPVRIGNGAVKQLQLDAYGQLLEAAYLYGKAGGSLTENNWKFLAGLVDVVCDRWQKPDRGIWEMRDEPRHFTHSKANCWLALHRGIEEVDPTTGEALGNFPQAFSHMAVVTSCAHLTAALQGLIPAGAHDYSELALDRLLATRR